MSKNNEKTTSLRVGLINIGCIGSQLLTWSVAIIIQEQLFIAVHEEYPDFRGREAILSLFLEECCLYPSAIAFHCLLLMANAGWLASFTEVQKQ